MIAVDVKQVYRHTIFISTSYHDRREAHSGGICIITGDLPRRVVNWGELRMNRLGRNRDIAANANLLIGCRLMDHQWIISSSIDRIVGHVQSIPFICDRISEIRRTKMQWCQSDNKNGCIKGNYLVKIIKGLNHDNMSRPNKAVI